MHDKAELLYPVYAIQPLFVQPVVKPGCTTGLTYTIQPVVKPVVNPVECLYTRHNRLDNRLYRVNGALHSRLRFPVGKNRVWLRFLVRLRLLANIRTYYAGDHKLGPNLTQCGRAEAYTSIPSDIVIHPTVWPQYNNNPTIQNRRDRQTGKT